MQVLPASVGAFRAWEPVGIDGYHQLDDARLVRAIVEHDERALAEAYRRHADGCFGLARRVILDRALAEEVVQELFVRLWNRPELYEPDRGSLRSFLIAQAHGRSVDLLRAEAARRRREEREARERIAQPIDLGKLRLADRSQGLPQDEDFGTRQAVEDTQSSLIRNHKLRFTQHLQVLGGVTDALLGLLGKLFHRALPLR